MTHAPPRESPPPGEVRFAGPEGWARWSFVALCAALPWTIAPMSLAAGACVALTLPLWVRSRAARGERTPVDAPALAWMLALALSALFALDRSASLARLPKSLFPLLVPLAAFHARDPRAGRRAVAVAAVSALAAALFGLAVAVFHGGGMEARARGAVGHYMTFAGQLLLGTSLAAGVALAAREARWRALGVGVALAGTLALAATFTRSAWLGLAVALATLLGLLRPRLLPALAVAVAVALLIAPAPLRQRALSGFDPRDPTTLERTYMWRAGLAMFRDRPLTGVGLGDLKPIYERYRPPEARERAGHLHSVPVQIAATTGIAGLAAFGWLIAGLFRAAGGGLPAARGAGGLAVGVRAGVVAGLAGFLAAGLFEWNFGDEELLYLLYTLIGIAWAAGRWGAPAAGARP